MVAAHAAYHLARRGVEAAQAHIAGYSPQYIAKLQQDADLYEQAGPEKQLKPEQMLPLLITGVIFMLLIASIRYTLGEVVASLAMIESPTTTAIIDSKGPPPPYADEPDAPLEKESLIPSEAQADADVEVTLINNKPITANLRQTIGLLHRVGGFRARWRGLGLSIMYHFLHGVGTNLFAGMLGLGLLGHAITYIFMSVALSRVHMVWTHSMIAHPSQKSWFARLVPRKQSKAVLLPSLVFATAQQATFILPVAVAFLVAPSHMPGGMENGVEITQVRDHHACGGKMALLALRFLAVPATALIVALAVLLPAAVTLTRIEAALLPEDQETIVPFDRQALLSTADISVRGGCKKLFVEAWRTFDRAARLRLIALYAKMIMIQLMVVLVAVHFMIAELFVVGGEKLAIFMTSAAAQLKLMAIEAQQNGQ